MNRSALLVPILAICGGLAVDADPTLPQRRVPLKVSDMTPAPDSTVNSTLTEITVDLDGTADDVSISTHAVTLVGDGVDDTFGTPDDVIITPDAVTLVGGTQVKIDLATTVVPNDTYRVTLSGTADVTSGLLNHWELDDGSGTTAIDSSGTDDGTVSGATWVTGRILDGLEFNGDDDSVDISAADVVDPWSVAMWVKREDAVNLDARLMDSETGAGGMSLRLEQYNNTNKVGITKYTVADYASNYTAPIGTWVHLTYTNDGTDTRLYADGALQHTFSVSWDAPRWNLGSAGIDSSLKGVLDDVRVYDRVLTDTEIESLAALAGAVRDTTGILLDGEYTGSFPSGDGTDGGDFEADFILDVSAPADPTLLTATTSGTTSIDLAWTDNATNEDEYIVDRSLDGIAFSQLTTLAVDSTTYVDLGLCPSKTYWYRVRATNGTGDSADSNVDNDTTDFVAATITVTDMDPLPDAVLDPAPTEVLLTLSGDIDAATVTTDTVTLVRAGTDGTLGTPDDVEIVPISVSIVGTTQVRMALDTGTLVNDLYQVTLSGTTGPYPGLVHWWKLEAGSGDTIFDATASALHGTISGPTWDLGRLGNGLSFAGGSDDVLLAETDLVVPWTLAVWVNRTDSPAGDARIMDPETFSGGTIRLESFNNTNKVGVAKYGVSDNPSNYEAPEGTWVHLTFMGNGTDTELYVNGVFTDTINLDIDLPRYYLGSQGLNSMVGFLDEVMVFDELLSDERIRQLAALGGGIRDDAQVLLDGEYTGTFPSGDGAAGGDFQAEFTIDVIPPADPSDLTAETLNLIEIQLDWTDNSSDEDGFKIEIGLDDVNFTVLDQVPANTTTYVATGLDPATEYFFRVRATKAGTVSGPSNVASATTDDGLVFTFEGSGTSGTESATGSGSCFLTIVAAPVGDSGILFWWILLACAFAVGLRARTVRARRS